MKCSACGKNDGIVTCVITVDCMSYHHEQTHWLCKECALSYGVREEDLPQPINDIEFNFSF